MYGTSPTKADERAAMATLQAKGIAKVNIEFSGGNDEGGPDGIDFLDAEGNSVKMPSSQAGEREEWNPTTRTYVSKGWQVYERTDKGYEARPATDEEIAIAKVGKVLEAPIYDRYGSFAGEFHAYGTLTWDVATGKHEMHGQESHEVYEDF